MCFQHLVHTTVQTREGQVDHLHGPNINFLLMRSLTPPKCILERCSTHQHQVLLQIEAKLIWQIGMRIPTLTLFIGDILICELPERLNLEKAHRVDHLVVNG